MFPLPSRKEGCVAKRSPFERTIHRVSRCVWRPHAARGIPTRRSFVSHLTHKYVFISLQHLDVF